MHLQGSASCAWLHNHGFGTPARGPRELRPVRSVRWVVRAKKSFYDDRTQALSFKVRRRLERLLPLTPSDEPARLKSAASVDVVDDSLPSSVESQGLSSSSEIRKRKQDNGAVAVAEIDKHHHHHEHREGQLAAFFNQSLARLGIDLSDRAKGLLCLNLLVLLYATNWVSLHLLSLPVQVFLPFEQAHACDLFRHFTTG